MSKIEEALNKARRERGNLPVPVSGAVERPATVTALVSDGAGRPETIARMALRELPLLSPDQLSERGIIYKDNVANPAVQVFRDLRTKIIQQSKEKNAVILVTGVAKGSGSSFVAQNLAAAFAFDVAKTALVIDCNFRHPSVHRLLPKASVPGLIDYLEDSHIDIDKVVHPVGIARLRVISAGRRPSTEAEHFTSAKMMRLMDSVRRRYTERFVILDGPPMTDSADIRILSEFADCVLVVARYGRATHAQIDNCLSAISERKLVGVVFNDEPRIPRTPRQESAWRSGGGRDSRGPSG